MTTVPYSVISTIEYDHHTVTFFVSGVEIDDDDIPQFSKRKYIRFENIEDPEGVEGIASNAKAALASETNIQREPER